MRKIDEFGTVGVWEIDLSNDSIICSPEMLSLWGLDEKTFEGNRNLLQDRVHPDDVEAMKKAINEAIKEEMIYELEYRIYPTPGVEKKILSRGQCSYDARTKKPLKFSGIVFDVTSVQ